MRNYSILKNLQVCFLFAVLLFAAAPAVAQTDAEFQKEMNDYKEKLQKVKTGPEGIKLLNEMMAKQQAYLAKKTDTVKKIKAKYGTDQAVSAITGIYNSDKGFDNNPLYTKCLVVAHFTYHETSTESYPKEGGNSQFNEDDEGTIQVTTYLFKYLNRIVLALQPDAITNIQVSGGYTVNSTDHSHSGTHTYSSMASAIADPLPGVSLSYDSPQNWSAGIKLNYRGTFKDENGSREDTPSPAFNTTNTDGQININGNTITIKHTISEHTNTHNNNGTQTLSRSGMLTITISPPQSDKYVAYLTPVMGDDAFDKWLPEGYDPVSHAHGNYVDVKIKLVKTASPGQDVNSMIKFIKWELPAGDVSRVPGYANNGPSETVEQYQHPSDNDPISRLADMQLHLTSEQPDTSVEHLTDSSDVTNNYAIRVWCFDYGAYAKLTAHVVLNDGTEVIAKDQSSDHAFLLLPKRTPNSRIATYFKQQNNAIDKDDNADDEKLVADDKYPGDGFTLYEEYRGWMENKKHIRGDPNAKDVMVLDDINTSRSRDGITMYQSVLSSFGGHVVVHHNFKRAEFGLQRSAPTASESVSSPRYGYKVIPRDKWLNFNFAADLHEVDQHGMCITSSPMKLGYAVTCKTDRTKHFCGTPKNCDYVVISADYDPGEKGYSVVQADVTGLGDIKTGMDAKGKVITDEYASTIAHEMLHNSGVNHHGPNDYNDGKPSLFTPQDNGLWTVNGVEDVRVSWENAPTVPITADDPEFAKLLGADNFELMIRAAHAYCSGDEDCIMRYDDAVGYTPTNSHAIYLIHKAGSYGELTGITLCKSKKGTGVNADSHKPVSRYGDATYGDCLHQYCINDKYADAKQDGL